MRKTTSCKKTRESPGGRQFKRFWNWFGKSKCPGARLDLTVNFHHEHFIDPTDCPWVSEDVLDPNVLIYIPYPPRVNCLKAIPFTAAHTYIAHNWQYPPHPRNISVSTIPRNNVLLRICERPSLTEES